MARVPVQRERTVQQQGLPQVFQSGQNAPIDAFGVSDGAGGRSLSDFGETLGVFALKIQEEDNGRETRELETQWRAKLSLLMRGDQDNPGYLSQQGVNAIGSFASTQEQINKAREEILGTASNKQVAELFDEVSTGKMLSAYDQMATHVGAQRIVAQIAASEARVSQYISDAAAAPDDVEAFNEASAVITNEIANMAQFGGWGEDMIDVARAEQYDTLVTSVVEAKIVQAVDDGDWTGVEQLFGQTQHYMSGVGRADLAATVQTEMIPFKAQELAELAAARGGSILDQIAWLEDTLSGALEDAAVRQRTQSYSLMNAQLSEMRAAYNFQKTLDSDADILSAQETVMKWRAEDVPLSEWPERIVEIGLTDPAAAGALSSVASSFMSQMATFTTGPATDREVEAQAYEISAGVLADRDLTEEEAIAAGISEAGGDPDVNDKVTSLISSAYAVRDRMEGRADADEVERMLVEADTFIADRRAEGATNEQIAEDAARVENADLKYAIETRFTALLSLEAKAESADETAEVREAREAAPDKVKELRDSGMTYEQVTEALQGDFPAGPVLDVYRAEAGVQFGIADATSSTLDKQITEEAARLADALRGMTPEEVDRFLNSYSNEDFSEGQLVVLKVKTIDILNQMNLEMETLKDQTLGESMVLALEAANAGPAAFEKWKAQNNSAWRQFTPEQQVSYEERARMTEEVMRTDWPVWAEIWGAINENPDMTASEAADFMVKAELALTPQDLAPVTTRLQAIMQGQDAPLEMIGTAHSMAATWVQANLKVSTDSATYKLFMDEFTRRVNRLQDELGRTPNEADIRSMMDAMIVRVKDPDADFSFTDFRFELGDDDLAEYLKDPQATINEEITDDQKVRIMADFEETNAKRAAEDPPLPPLPPLSNEDLVRVWFVGVREGEF